MGRSVFAAQSAGQDLSIATTHETTRLIDESTLIVHGLEHLTNDLAEATGSNLRKS
jgi:hypothetical protein